MWSRSTAVVRSPQPSDKGQPPKEATTRVTPPGFTEMMFQRQQENCRYLGHFLDSCSRKNEGEQETRGTDPPKTIKQMIPERDGKKQQQQGMH